jgi:hypothetical protein
MSAARQAIRPQRTASEIKRMSEIARQVATDVANNRAGQERSGKLHEFINAALEYAAQQEAIRGRRIDPQTIEDAMTIALTLTDAPVRCSIEQLTPAIATGDVGAIVPTYRVTLASKRTKRAIGVVEGTVAQLTTLLGAIVGLADPDPPAPPDGADLARTDLETVIAAGGAGRRARAE